MRSMRLLTILLISAVLLLGVVIDRTRNPAEQLLASSSSLVPSADPTGSTWFCPGGSNSAGPARAGIEVINTSADLTEVELTAMGSGLSTEPVAETVSVEGGGRAVIALDSLVPGDPWSGAVVETSSGEVIVDQLFDGPTGTDRSPCLTQTANSWIVPNGATRIESDGEQMILVLLNPFPDDAVVDVEFDADVGLDSLDGVVAPAHRVTAIDITDEVTVASRVSAILDVVSGRLVVERVQTHDSESARGLSVEMASPGGAPLTYMLTVGNSQDRTDVLTVTNPSHDEIAQVDVEIVADTDLILDPIELTIHPRRTVTVNIPDESRLAGLEFLTLAVRSLSGIPVAASLDSVVVPGGDSVVGAASESGADVASMSWLIPVEAADSGVANVVVVNPSPVAVSRVSFSVLGPDGPTEISTVELGPSRRTSVSTEDLGGLQSVVSIVASSPIVAGIESAGLTSRSMSVGVRTGEAVAFSDLT